jgi:hypothetical protein
MVEYSLVISGVVVVSIASLNYLTEQSTESMDNSADCVSTRPPPVSCQVRAVTTTTATTTPGVTTTIAPELTTTTTAPPVSVVQLGTPGFDHTVSPWTVTPIVEVRTDPGTGFVPVEGAVVTFQFTTFSPNGNQTTVASCTTSASGQCTWTEPAAYTDGTAIEITVVSIDSDPPVSTIPGSITVPGP